MRGKPKPIGGLLSDCILRRLNNEAHLAEVDAFQGIPLAGFSTFGEMFGLNINQTLTALFFFSSDVPFPDPIIDRFPIHYASFCRYFDRRDSNRMRTLDGLRHEQEQMQRALRREHEFSTALISSLPWIFFLLDVSGKLVLWNENMEMVTQQSADSLLNLPAKDLVCAEDGRRFTGCVDRAIEVGVAAEEVRLIGRSGLVPYYITAHSIDLDGARYVTGIGIDIRDRKHMEAAIKASRTRLKLITDSLAEAVMVVEKAGAIVFANPSAKRMLECTDMGDVEGLPIDSILRLKVTKPGGSPSVPWMKAIVEGIATQDDDAILETTEGTTRPIAYVCSPLIETDAKSAAVISFRDILALKEAQRELIQSSRLASVGQLAAGIAHEINTPVQYIGTSLSFIGSSFDSLIKALEGKEIESQLKFLLDEIPMAIEESLDGVAQISRIVLSMKEFSHPGTTSKAMTDLNRALKSTISVSCNVWKNVATVVEDFDPELPMIPCLAGELNQVFLNFIVNATHAIESSGKTLPGTITVSTRNLGTEVEIRVADSGTGVPESIRDRIFDPFFTTKGVGKGTGQGLAICRDVVVVKHGGSLGVEGEEGKGAIFVVRLPIEGIPDEPEGLQE